MNYNNLNVFMYKLELKKHKACKNSEQDFALRHCVPDAPPPFRFYDCTADVGGHMVRQENWIHTDVNVEVCGRYTYSIQAGSGRYTPCLKKTVQTYFCQNFVKFRPIAKIFGTEIAKRTSFSEVYSFSTSSNLWQRTTLLNADVLNCYIIL